MKFLLFSCADAAMRLLVQIQAYLDNMFDVGVEDAETKNALLEHVEELQEHNTQVRVEIQTHMLAEALWHSRSKAVCRCVTWTPVCRRTRGETIEKVSGLDKKLIQTSEEVELLKVEIIVLTRFSFLFYRNDKSYYFVIENNNNKKDFSRFWLNRVIVNQYFI